MTGKEDTTLEQNNELNEIQLKDEWLIRDCSIYKDEYDDCTGLRARFHQYFIYGKTIDCNQWKKDYNNCCKWVNDKDPKAAETLIESERARRYKRLQNHYRNNIWKPRDAPPSDFNKPLPEWLVKRNENTYLAYKAKEMEEGKVEENSGSICSIM